MIVKCRRWLFQDGMGQLKITNEGIQLSGKAFFLDDLVASTIKTRKDRSLTLESYKNFTIKTTDENGNFSNQIYIGE